MSLRACLASGQDASGLDVCGCTPLGTEPGNSQVLSKVQLVQEALAGW